MSDFSATTLDFIFGANFGAGSDFSCRAAVDILSVVSGRGSRSICRCLDFSRNLPPSAQRAMPDQSLGYGKGCVSSGSRAMMSAISGLTTRGVLSGFSGILSATGEERLSRSHWLTAGAGSKTSAVEARGVGPDGYIFLREGWRALRYPIKRRGLILIPYPLQCPGAAADLDN
jgi:hypothetical protein